MKLYQDTSSEVKQDKQAMHGLYLRRSRRHHKLRVLRVKYEPKKFAQRVEAQSSFRDVQRVSRVQATTRREVDSS